MFYKWNDDVICPFFCFFVLKLFTSGSYCSQASVLVYYQYFLVFILIGFILQFSLLWKRVCVCASVCVCLSACEFPLLDAGGSSQESSLLFFAYR